MTHRPAASGTKPHPQNPPSQNRPAGKGLVVAPTAATSQDGLPMPQERDQLPGSVAKAPDPIIEQAARDLAAGQVDTDMRATPGLDAARRDRMVPTPRPRVAGRRGR